MIAGPKERSASGQRSRHSSEAGDNWYGIERAPDPFRDLNQPYGVNRIGGSDDFGIRGLWDVVLSRGMSSIAGSRVDRPFEQNGWVHSALKVKGSAVRSLPIRFYTSDPAIDKEAQAVEGGPLVELFNNPSPDYTSSDFFEAGLLHRSLSGEDFWIFRNSQRQIIRGTSNGFIPLPSEIEPVIGHRVQHHINSQGFVDEWRFGQYGSAEDIVLRTQDVVQFRDYDPYNPWRGLGDVQVLHRYLVQELSADRYVEAILRHSGDPGGFILMKHRLGRDQQREAQRRADDQLGPDKRGRWRVLSGEGAEMIQNKVTPKDLEFEKLFHRIRELIASVLGVPLPVLGVLDRATWNNYAQADLNFWTGGNGVIAYCRTVEDKIQNRFLPKMRQARLRNLYPRFDFSQVEALGSTEAEKRESATALVERVKGMTWNEAAQIVGLDTDPTMHGDVAVVPTSTVTFERMVEDSENPPQPEPAPEAPSGDADEEDTEDPEDETGNGEAAAILASRDLPTPDREARLEYWRALENEILERGDKTLKTRVRRYLRDYEKAQLTRLRTFAEEGPYGVLREDGVELNGNGRPPRSMARAVSNQLTEADVNILLVAKAEWEEILVGAVDGPLDEIFELAGKGMASELGTSFLGMNDPRVIEFLFSQKIRLAEGVTSTLANRVAKSLIQVFADNETIGTLQTLVKEHLSDLEGSLAKAFSNKDQRALTIARTETGKATNGARLEQMKADGIDRHEWISSGDVHVRKMHDQLDGVVVKVGENFGSHASPSVDGLTAPHADTAPAHAVINCRCVTRPASED